MKLSRRQGLLWAAAALGGCAAEPAVQGPAPAAGQPAVWRTLRGGYLVDTLPGVGLPRPPASGMFVRWTAPSALALRGQELLVADRAGARLWRCDAWGSAMTAVAGAPVLPGLALALGLDYAAWVLDSAARQVLRFGRDGRLLQSWTLGLDQPTPVDLLLLDGGHTLLVADGLGGRWTEQRGPGSLVREVVPQAADGRRVMSVAALAPGPQGQVLVLDRLNAVVHVCTRGGRVQASLGQGDLLQPVALAAGRSGLVFVIDAQDQSLKLLQPGQPVRRFSAAQLGLQQLGALAADGDLLAVSDPVGGQVQLLDWGRVVP